MRTWKLRNVITLIGVCLLVGIWAIFARGSKETLRHAVVVEDRVTVAKLLHSHPNWAQTVVDVNEGTPLNIAVETDNEELVRMVLQYPCNLNYAAPACGTPLQWACSHSKLKIVQCLVNTGANLNFAPKTGNASGTPLQHAVWFERVDVVEYLVSKGADVNGVDQSGHLEPAVILVLRGIQDKTDWTERRRIFHFLLDHGAVIPDPTTLGMNGRGAIRIAKAFHAPDDIVEIIREHGGTE